MKRAIFILALAITAYACEKHIEHQEVIKKHIFIQNGFVDPQYKSIEIKLSDTIFIKDKVQSLRAFIDSNMLIIDAYFDIDLEKLNEYRNQELTLRRNPNYYEFVFSEQCYSAWCREIREKIIKLDEIIKIYPNIDTLEVYKLAAWFEIRKFDYHELSRYKEMYQHVTDEISKIERIKAEKDSLNSINANAIFSYKVTNKFKAYNSFMKETQILNNRYTFNDKMEIVNIESLN